MQATKRIISINGGEGRGGTDYDDHTDTYPRSTGQTVHDQMAVPLL